MANEGQITGMRGVYLVAAELSREGLIVSPTSRSAKGADIVVTDQKCQKTYSVQVKTNATTFNFWLVGEHAKEMKSDTYIYVFVNLKNKKGNDVIEYFVVPSKIVAENIETDKQGKWESFYYKNAKKYDKGWSIFKT